MTLPLLITPGDPDGIGPEVSVKAAKALGVAAILIGDVDACRRWAPDLPVVEAIQPVDGLCAMQPPAGEPMEVAAVRLGAEACLDKRASALVTGPIHKERLVAQGFQYAGHTDLLGAICGRDPMMAFVGAGLRVGLVTAHIPLAKVPDAVDEARIEHCIRLCLDGLSQLEIDRKRVVLAGVNPHAGERGVLGQEEAERVGPVCERLREEGLDVVGPLAAESAFLALRQGQADMLLAMYHDQGLTPLKMVAFGELVNWSLGLPIIRTSVDHGTAYDIAGKGVADPRSMEEAIRLALQLSASAGSTRSHGA